VSICLRVKSFVGPGGLRYIAAIVTHVWSLRREASSSRCARRRAVSAKTRVTEPRPTLVAQCFCERAWYYGISSELGS
jgi:hypothetical protein